MWREKILHECNRGSETSIILILEYLIFQAYEDRASDIHIDPTEHALEIRFRIDGFIVKVYTLSKELHAGILGRIKILCNLRTDEHSQPQDGRFRCADPHNSFIDIRVSILATYYGEDIVLRLLRTSSHILTLTELGIQEADRIKINKALSRSSGMILVTGPTGSGKTTSLYTLLSLLNSGNKMLVTLEDPVEYALAGIRQIQTNKNKSVTFANGLRSVLRQDPDIIMVGEIRDAETARIAVHAAMTGHLLLSTLHTKDAASTLPRLLDMGIEPYLISSTVEIVIAQRLVRKICTLCNKNGCEMCNQSGFKGRTTLCEVLHISPSIRTAIFSRAHEEEVRALAIKEGMQTMYEDGVAKAQAGITTLEEVISSIDV